MHEGILLQLYLYSLLPSVQLIPSVCSKQQNSYLKEYKKMPSLKDDKGSFAGGGLVCVPHKLQSKLWHVVDFLKDMTASVVALMVKVVGRC